MIPIDYALKNIVNTFEWYSTLKTPSKYPRHCVELFGKGTPSSRPGECSVVVFPGLRRICSARGCGNRMGGFRDFGEADDEKRENRPTCGSGEAAVPAHSSCWSGWRSARWGLCLCRLHPA